MNSKTGVVLVIFVVFAIGATAGAYIFGNFPEACESRYSYVNPDFACGSRPAISKESYAPFRLGLVSFIEEEKASGRLDEVSLYFRDLVAGPTFGINELETFVPASLLKIPLALIYMRLEEDRPGLLASVVKYTKEPSQPVQYFKPERSLKLETPYTIEEMLRYLIAYSDNVAYSVLGDYLNKIPDGNEYAYQVYRELGVINPMSGAAENMSTHGYASIFRLLYNSSFVSVDLSEKMLSWLAESRFDTGIAAGVPESVAVANKFGERFYLDSEEGKQLHDCGIIYYPGNPYVLCVMTRGKDLDVLGRVISDISRMVYDEVDSRRI